MRDLEWLRAHVLGMMFINDRALYRADISPWLHLLPSIILLVALYYSCFQITCMSRASHIGWKYNTGNVLKRRISKHTNRGGQGK